MAVRPSFDVMSAIKPKAAKGASLIAHETTFMVIFCTDSNNSSKGCELFFGREIIAIPMNIAKIIMLSISPDRNDAKGLLGINAVMF